MGPFIKGRRVPGAGRYGASPLSRKRRAEGRPSKQAAPLGLPAVGANGSKAWPTRGSATASLIKCPPAGPFGPPGPAPAPAAPQPRRPACRPAGASRASPPRSCPCPRPAGSSRRPGACSRPGARSRDAAAAAGGPAHAREAAAPTTAATAGPRRERGGLTHGDAAAIAIRARAAPRMRGRTGHRARRPERLPRALRARRLGSRDFRVAGRGKMVQAFPVSAFIYLF